VLHAILQVFIIIVYENVFQNPELFRTQVSLSTEQSTLVAVRGLVNFLLSDEWLRKKLPSDTKEVTFYWQMRTWQKPPFEFV
jgi:hypothetical protein